MCFVDRDYSALAVARINDWTGQADVVHIAGACCAIVTMERRLGIAGSADISGGGLTISADRSVSELSTALDTSKGRLENTSA